MADIFSEIDEDIRRERLQKLWKRFGPHLIGLALLIVVGIGGWRGYQYMEAQKAAEASAQFEAAAALAESGKQAEADAALAKIAAESGSPAYRTIARLRQAASLAASDPKAAVAAFDAIAADGGAERSFRDLAGLRSGFLLVDIASFDDMKTRLEPLAGGSVHWEGEDLARVPPHRRGFGLVFQDGQLFGQFSVAGNIAYGLRAKRMPRARCSRWPARSPDRRP